MMTFQQILNFFTQMFRWWVIVAPWEQALRVRFGKHVKVLDAGFYFRIPFIDRIYRQSTRLRYTDCPPQTMTTADGKTVTASGTCGFAITNIQTLYDTLHHPDDTVMNMAMAALSKVVGSRELNACDQASIEKEVSDALELRQYGLSDATFRLLEFANVRAIRLINTQKWMQSPSIMMENDQVIA